MARPSKPKTPADAESKDPEVQDDQSTEPEKPEVQPEAATEPPADAAESTKVDPVVAPVHPESVKVTHNVTLAIAMGNGVQHVRFFENQVVTELHKIKALLAAGVAQVMDEAKKVVDEIDPD